MKTLVSLVGFGAGAFWRPACTVVAPRQPRRRDDDDHSDSDRVPTRCRRRSRSTASVLFVANLERSSANLSDHYAAIWAACTTTWAKVGLQPENMGLIATYGDQYGPRLLLGRRAGSRRTRSSRLSWLTRRRRERHRHHGLRQPVAATSSARWANISDGDLPIALQLLAASGNFDGDGEPRRPRT